MTVTLADVQLARERIASAIHRTPVMTCAALNEMAGASLTFKCEQFQKVGAFKFRGAMNAVSQLSREQCAAGVVTHSSGNHAQALALAAKLRKIPAHIVMPSDSSPVKIAAVRGYGANVTLCEPTLSSRETTANSVQIKTGATFVHPYDSDDIIAGAGTAALELWQEAGPFDIVITPVGGGGLLSGTCAAIKGLDSTVSIVAAEPAGADDAARSKQAGRLIQQTNPQTIADGLRTSLGQRTWPFVRDHVEQVITVSEEEIISAMRILFERAKLLVEPSSATVLAAVLSKSFPREFRGRKIGLILSGGNINLEALPWK